MRSARVVVRVVRLALGAGLLALGLCVPAEVTAQQLDIAELTARVGIDQRLGAVLPARLELVNEQGAAVRLDALMGERPAILHLVYYECPMLCGVTLRSLFKTLKVLGLELGVDYDLITVSIDPEETPAAARAIEQRYLEQLGRADDPVARDGWHALTGRADAITALAETVGFRYLYDPSSDEYAHGAAVMVVTPERQVARYLYGVEYPARDLRLGLVEAASERIGSVADQVLLLCYRYDPKTGTYGFAVWTAVRLGGLATIVALVAFITISLRRERDDAPIAPDPVS